MDKIPVASVWLYKDNGLPPSKQNTLIGDMHDANTQIIKWAHEQWSKSNVKVYFIITFVDGETFNNEIEVHRYHLEEDTPLTNYVEKLAYFYAGMSRNGMGEEEYWQLMLATDAAAPGAMQTMKEFLQIYDLRGVFTNESDDDQT